MKFSIERQQLLSSLLLVVGAIEKKSTNPLLSNLLIEAKKNKLFLCGTDTEIQLLAEIPLTLVEYEGRTTVPARKLIDICRSFSDEDILTLSLKGERVLISSGRSRFNLSSLPADDFPLVVEERSEFEFQVETAALISLIQVTHFSMAQQDVRVYLNGMLLELSAQSLYGVSTDGHRLSIGKLPVDTPLPEQKFILPRKGVIELLRLLNEISDASVLVHITSKHFYLSSEKYQFISKLIDERFPPYKRVIPVNNDKHFLVERDILRQALSRVSILANEKYRAVTLSMSVGKLVINAVNQEQEEAIEELELDTQGAAISIGINASYLMDVLSHVPPGLVKISLSEPDKSILVESLALPIAKYVIMPLTI